MARRHTRQEHVIIRIGEKRLADLSDRELDAELQRRRRLRGGRSAAPDATETPRLAAAAQRATIRQWYANLELKPGASTEQVEAAFERLMARYHPDKHRGDPEKHRAATVLAQGLTEARQGLLDHLRQQR